LAVEVEQPPSTSPPIQWATCAWVIEARGASPNLGWMWLRQADSSASRLALEGATGLQPLRVEGGQRDASTAGVEPLAGAWCASLLLLPRHRIALALEDPVATSRPWDFTRAR
jgi:hypothetical protein